MKLKGVLLALIASTIIPLGSPSISQAANPSCTPSSTRVTTDGYLVESFTATNNSTTTTCDWSVPLGVSAVDVLVVGGGGGGGYDSGGGGGGGGVIYQTNKSVSGVITIVIGAGGKGVCLARYRLLCRRGADRLRLRPGAGFRAGDGGAVSAAEPGHRHRLRIDRSTRQDRRMSASAAADRPSSGWVSTARHARHVVSENPVTGIAFMLFMLLVLAARCPTS